jgi:hypothetical protein
MSFSERLNKHLALQADAIIWAQSVFDAERAVKHSLVSDPGLCAMDAARMYFTRKYHTNPDALSFG